MASEAKPDSATGLRPLPDESLPKLGEYEVMAELAKGGMGRVYLARRLGQGGFERLFAIKVLSEEMVDEPEALMMLLDEANIASKLHHPNVVPIIDIGEHESGYYLVMEYVDGCSMSQLLRRHKGSRPSRLVMPMIIDALRGLHAAHELTDNEGNPTNLVHRDFSPHNLLVGIDGNCRVTDFGIAKVEARFVNTLAGLNKGKLAYMSPEQLAAARDIDRRADIWAAGVVLWYALTGEHPFRGESEATTTRNILRRDAAAPSTVGLMPPDCFDPVCRRALSRERAKRYSTALEMADDLHQIAIKNDLLGSPSEVSEWVRRLFKKDFDKRHAVIRELRGSKAGGSKLPVLPRLTLSGSQIASALSSSRFTPFGSTPSSGSKVPDVSSSISAIRAASPAPTPAIPAANPSAIPPPIPSAMPPAIPPPIPSAMPPAIPPGVPPMPAIPPPLPLAFAPAGSPTRATPVEAPVEDIHVILGESDDGAGAKVLTPATPVSTAAPLEGPRAANRRLLGLIVGVGAAVVVGLVVVALALGGVITPFGREEGRGGGDGVGRAGIDRGAGPDGGAYVAPVSRDGGAKVAADDVARDAGPARPGEAGAAKTSVSVVLRGLPTGAKVRVDGNAVEHQRFTLLADGFEHVIRVDAPGYVQWVHKLAPQPGSTSDVVVDVEAVERREPEPETQTPAKTKLVRDPGF